MPEFDPASHVVNLSADGRLQTPATQIPCIFQSLVESGLDSLTIYFHGEGMGKQAGPELAADLYSEIRGQFQSYPVFFLWDSGLLETLQSQMLDILTGSPLFLKLYHKLVKHVAYKLVTDLGAETVPPDLLRMLKAEVLPTEDLSSLSLEVTTSEALGELTEAQVLALRQDLAGDVEAVQLLGDILAHADQTRATGSVVAEPLPGREVGYLSGQVLRKLLADSLASAVPEGDEPAPAASTWSASPEAWRFVESLLAGVVGRFRKGTDHGLAGTVLEEIYRQLYADKIGIYRWAEIKRDVRDAYASNAAGRPENSSHGGALFIDQLKQHLDEHSTLRVHLVGCGSGTVHVCHFIERAAQVLDEGFRFENVVLLAPVTSLDAFRSGIVEHADRIANLHIFVMADEYERRDPLLKPAPLLYPHSLLYLISGLLEAEPDTPLVGLARHHHNERFLQYREQLGAQVVYSITADDAPPGQRARFTSHHGKAGSPSYDRSTLESIAVLVRPAPAEEPRSFDLEITPEIKRLLEPEVTEAGVRCRLLSWLPRRRPQRELGQRDIIDTSEIVYHETLASLIKAGRSVARVLTPGIEGLSAVEPEEREAHWQAAKESDEITEGWTGTGWILGQARRVLVTNNHVLPLRQAAEDAVAQFGYESGYGTDAKLRYIRSFSPGELFFTSPNYRFDGLDYTAVALSEPATEETGYLEPSRIATAGQAERIYVVQHPRGDPKAYVFNHNKRAKADDRYVTYYSDTEEGSSGSPLFDDSMRLVGIHHLGGQPVTDEGREKVANLGSCISAVIQDLVEKLADAKWDEDRVRHWFGEGLVLELFKDRVQ